MGENEPEPLAKTRTRRSNAGARMHEMIFNAEVDPHYAQAFGDLLKTDDDSSDDEEYIPKELENQEDAHHIDDEDDADQDEARLRSDEQNDDDDDDEDDDNSQSDQSSEGSDEEDEDEDDSDSGSGDTDQGDSEEDEENDEDYQVGKKFKKSRTDNGTKLLKKIKKEQDDCKSPKKEGNKLNQVNIKPGSPSLHAYKACRKICSVCLGDKSGEDDEIIECDLCGISVHEACYGASREESEGSDENGDEDDANTHDNDDANTHDDDDQSTTSSTESTEPWFCEPCRRSVKQPVCELCPNLGGIFKETDTGRWVHMVCALYTRGVTFENVDKLTDVSLFELNYALFGSKACVICEDRRLARTGICIGCDAGLCKTFFHPTCAQKEGLLFESHSDEVDPYFAQCKQHADKDIIKKKKKLFTALHARLKRVQTTQDQQQIKKENSTNDNTCNLYNHNNLDRIQTKLAELAQEGNPHFTKWTKNNPPPIPKKVSRMLLTSPSLIIRLNKKSQIMGLDTTSAASHIQDEMEAARQKWHIPPAFDLEFVAYCLDRTTRMADMKKKNIDLVSQNLTLKSQEAQLRTKFNTLKDEVGQAKQECVGLISEIRAIQKSIANATGKSFNLSPINEQLISNYYSATKKSSSSSSKPAPDSKATNGNNAINVHSTYGCGKCNSIENQHLLALCDTCNSHIHIYCLDPPLNRVPKKTKFGGWQCSDCTEKDEDDEEEEKARQEEKQKQEFKTMGDTRRLRASKGNSIIKKFGNEFWT